MRTIFRLPTGQGAPAFGSKARPLGGAREPPARALPIIWVPRQLGDIVGVGQEPTGQEPYEDSVGPSTPTVRACAFGTHLDVKPWFMASRGDRGRVPSPVRPVASIGEFDSGPSQLP